MFLKFKVYISMVPEPVEGIGGASTSSATEKFIVHSSKFKVQSQSQSQSQSSESEFRVQCSKFGHTKCELIDSPPSTMMLCPVQNLFVTVRKYAHCAISFDVAHRLSGVCCIISSHIFLSLTTQSLSGVSTPPGSRLLHVAPN